MLTNVCACTSRYCGTITTRVSSELYEAAYLVQEEARKGVPEGGMLHFTIQPAGSACVKEGESRGGNCMGLEAVPQVCKCFFFILHYLPLKVVRH